MKTKMLVSYVGNLNDMPVYRLSLKNQTNEVFFVSVTIATVTCCIMKSKRY